MEMDMESTQSKTSLCLNDSSITQESIVPLDKVTDADYLLKKIRKQFRAIDEHAKMNQMHASTPPELHLNELLMEISKKKQEWEMVKAKRREEHRRKCLEAIRLKKLKESKPVRHEKGWDFSIASDRATEPPYFVDGLDWKQMQMLFEEKEKHGETMKKVKQPHEVSHDKPWLPTCLRGHNFGAASFDAINEDYINALEDSLLTNVKRCHEQLKKLQGTTDEILKHRMKCHQAIREFNAILEELKKQRTAAAGDDNTQKQTKKKTNKH